MAALPIVTSREYKLILNGDRFGNWEKGSQSFIEIVEFLAAQHGGKFIDNGKDDKTKKREVCYLDTPDSALRQQRLIVRIRKENSNKYKLLLKYRDGDRYIAAARPIAVKDSEYKFEEDITPPFVSKYSKSSSIKIDGDLKLENIDELANYFPVLKDLHIPAKSPLVKVGNFTAYETVYEPGHLKFGDNDIEVELSFSFWHLLEDSEEFPLIGEFSFNYRNDDGDFPIEMISGANGLFEALQKQAGWLDFSNSTKTAFAYEGW